MKNPTTDSAVALDHSSYKDRRTLVLFLFSLMVLLADVWPHPGPAQALHYAVRSQAGKQHLVVVDAQVKAQCSKLDTLEIFGKEVDARYALFLHQPLAINRADQRSLELLPGVGPHLARAITGYIDEHGPITSAEQLLRVPGIGPKTRDRLLPLIHFRLQ
nr:helix-hairpin-helix domain-containing protein [uncultured Desulfobulbus sp.]